MRLARGSLAAVSHEASSSWRKGFRVGSFVSVVAGLYFLGIRDEARAATTASRASASQMVYRYRMRHGGICPRDLALVVREASRLELPTDGWGRPFTLRCPSLSASRDFDLLSVDPDQRATGFD